MTLSDAECDQAVLALARWCQSQDLTPSDQIEIMGRYIRRQIAAGAKSRPEESAARRFYAATLLLAAPLLIPVSRET